MKNILVIIQIALAILLITAILLQHRGTGLGGAFASEAGFYKSKRGLEKILFNFTIALSIGFVIIVVVNTILR